MPGIRPDFWVLLGGLCLSVGLTAVVAHLENQSAEADFAAAAEQQLISLDTRIQRSVDQVMALGSFFDADPTLSRQQFKAVTLPILERHSALQALEWIPMLQPSDIRSYEKSARSEGFNEFHFQEKTADGNWAPLGARDTYFPVWYVEPYLGNERAFGFDLGSNPARRVALQKSIDTRLPAATARITLVQETGKQFGFLLFRPVFASASKGPTTLLGFTLGVYRIGQMVNSNEVGQFASSKSLQMMVFDNAAKPGERRLYPMVAPYEEATDIQGFSFRRDINVADRTWTLIAVPGSRGLEVDRRSSIIVLLAGFLLSILSATFYQYQKSRESAVEALVKLRTSELELSRAALKKVGDEAVHANRMKSVFLASMGHEFKTPMNAILGLLHVLERKTTDPGQKDYLEKIRLAAKRLLRLIDDILDISRIEAGKLNIVHTDFRLETVLKDLVTTVSARFKDKPVELVIDVDPDIPANLRGDSLRLTQILTNLVDNATKFTAAGQVALTLRFEAISLTRILMRGEVSDTGSGMSEDEVSQLFKPFFQAETTYKKQMGGTGLGLAICKQLIQLMEGNIAVSSVLGQGSRFSFELPFDRVNEEPYAKPQPELAALRLVIADQHHSARKAEETLMRHLGVSVRAVETLEELETISPDEKVWLTTDHPEREQIAAKLAGRHQDLTWILTLQDEFSDRGLKKPIFPSDAIGSVLAKAVNSSASSVTEPVARQSAPVFLPPRLRSRLRELRWFLVRGDLEASSRARELLGDSNIAPIVDVMKRVVEHCDNFEFRQARDVLNEIAGLIEE